MFHETLGIQLHNVATTVDPDWTDGGHVLHRAPPGVRQRVNVAARERLRHPTGCELRFVPEESVTVTLSAAERTRVWPFWGPFQGDPIALGPEPRTVEFAAPERVARLRDGVETGPFDERVCRLRFSRTAPVAVHGVNGPRRAPDPDEVPGVRYLAHGTSITEGEAASTPHLSYVARAARHAGVDPLNLGLSGSAFCEPAFADYLAGRDWDVATLALSVNMENRGFTQTQFRERVERFVASVADTGRPVVCITLFPYHADVVAGDDRERAQAFRTILRESTADHANVSLVSGPETMATTGLTTDLLHPGDSGLAAIGRAVGEAIERALA